MVIPLLSRMNRDKFDNLVQRGWGTPLPFTGEVDQLSWLVDPSDGANLSFELGFE
jgi:hypothetical protein